MKPLIVKGTIKNKEELLVVRYGCSCGYSWKSEYRPSYRNGCSKKGYWESCKNCNNLYNFKEFNNRYYESLKFITCVKPKMPIKEKGTIKVIKYRNELEFNCDCGNTWHVNQVKSNKISAQPKGTYDCDECGYKFELKRINKICK